MVQMVNVIKSPLHFNQPDYSQTGETTTWGEQEGNFKECITFKIIYNYVTFCMMVSWVNEIIYTKAW